ncbi:MAG TPA: hypothetical protein VJM15_08190 [Sphingomicrobium sp.]|nr:hypothetical protein [Sphingomicrobium sp.]
MTEPPRKRNIPYGELIAFAALIVSAIGVWIAWKATTKDEPTRVVEQRQPIALTLRGTVEDDGKRLVIAPVEPGHALQSLTLTITGSRIEAGSDGIVRSGDIESVVEREEDKEPHRVAVRVDARYVEMGKDRRATGNYVLRYRWEGGGLLGGRSLRLVSFARG